MSLPGVHKATAIQLVLNHAGIPWDDTIAFGDSMNDVEMIEFVAVRVAMADARPEVLRVSKLTTPPAGEDGLARGFSVLGLVEPGSADPRRSGAGSVPA